jgi:tetratricopeptide (TPR) repeat protein
MTVPTAAEIRLWSEAVAADPGSLSFLPLARAFRGSGRLDLALRLCVRGLERHPDHVEAHHLLGLIYRESGDPVKAFDEWDIALALDPAHSPSRREIGLVAHARGEWSSAVRHLERALEHDAFDAEVRDALEDAWKRAAAPPPPRPVAGAAAGATDTSAQSAAHAGLTALAGERGMLGAVLLDDQGFVLAGSMPVGGSDRAPEVAAILAGASAEAERAVAHLGLGAWRGILVETPDAIVHLAPASGAMVAVAARRTVPTGWALRIAARPPPVAVRLLESRG